MHSNGLSIGLIPDGNRRWAAIHEKSLREAYTVAAQRTAEAVLAFRDQGIRNVFIYGASEGNVRYRDPATLSVVVEAFVDTFRCKLRSFNQTGVQVAVVGDFSPVQLSLMREFERITALHDPSGNMKCVIVFNHSVEWELFQAAKKIGTPFGISDLLANLPSRDWPQLDILIRTAGVKRLSGFLPLQTTYAEFFFLDTLWPDISICQLNKVLVDFHERKRTFGR